MIQGYSLHPAMMRWSAASSAPLACWKALHPHQQENYVVETKSESVKTTNISLETCIKETLSYALQSAGQDVRVKPLLTRALSSLLQEQWMVFPKKNLAIKSGWWQYPHHKLFFRQTDHVAASLLPVPR